MEKLSAGSKVFTEEEKNNFLNNYGVEIHQVGDEIRLYGLNQNIDNAKGRIKKEIFFENNKLKVDEVRNMKPLKGGIAEQLYEIENWSSENNRIDLNRKRGNNKGYCEKLNLRF